MLFGLEIIAPVPILIITSGPHHGNVGSGIGEPGRKAKGITQYWIIFISSWSSFSGTARSPGRSPFFSFGRGVLLRRP